MKEFVTRSRILKLKYITKSFHDEIIYILHEERVLQRRLFPYTKITNNFHDMVISPLYTNKDFFQNSRHFILNPPKIYEL